jgi:hypothetical protein
MITDLNISVEEWLSTEDGDDVDRATGAEISIRVGSHLVTEVEDYRAKTVRPTIRASAAALASWLLSNWWRLRWEPYKELEGSEFVNWAMSHSLPAIGGGYVWPPLTLIGSNGRYIVANFEGRTQSEPAGLSPIRYLNSFDELIDGAAFESSVSDFIGSVIARLDSQQLRNTYLHELWMTVRAEKKNSKQLSLRRLEALLGLDPADDETIVRSLLRHWQQQVGHDALEEIAAASQASRVEDELRVAKDAASQLKTFAEVDIFSTLRAWARSEHSLFRTIPWKFGQEMAYKLREAWEFGMRPVTTRQIANRLEITASKLKASEFQVPFSFAVRGTHDEKLGFVLRGRHEQGRRFDIARLLGDHIGLETKDHWKPATKSLTARQKFQRAFAAEFLCPSQVVAERFVAPVRLDDLDELAENLAKEYEVSQQIVIYHLVNRGLIPSPAASPHVAGSLFSIPP